ncbi:helix-turn-helix domain-containing protein [Cytophagaceae bacterium YF14B1]|uniref:Helix-turn-helix domain-containing protein n=1 Tax=Xanthocytophaga flava TaxID=3048013 RepID=A0AAE3U8R2_9BACT|nr:helix-turn-helix domain-containing protein [Xanthocytophaga flavus]MDJ1483706.1 helix-turn-helix domain-containing protein [Xanthocytophaga flavus]
MNPRKVNILANFWLGILLFSFGCTLLDRPFLHFNTYVQYPNLIGVSELLSFAMAPSLYLSVVYFTSPGRKLTKTDFLHFIPWLLFLLHQLPFLFQSADTKLYLLTHPSPIPPNPYFGLVMFYIIKIQVVVYWILAYRKLLKHQKNIQLIASTTEYINLKWLKNFLFILACMVLLWFNEEFFKISIISTLTPLGYVLSTYFIVYFSLRQEEIFPYPPKDQVYINEIILESEQPVINKTQRLSSEKLEQLKIELHYRMQAEKLFLDSDLDLPDLASKMNITSHELSFVLNEGFGTNFYQFINTYRVEEAKTLLLSEKHHHLNMLGIAYEAGFSSKTTFNTYFKKTTGLSPSQYQATVKKQIQ